MQLLPQLYLVRWEDGAVDKGRRKKDRLLPKLPKANKLLVDDIGYFEYEATLLCTRRAARSYDRHTTVAVSLAKRIFPETQRDWDAEDLRFVRAVNLIAR